MLNLILFGPPGAGKGTQSAKLIDKYNLTHLSTGDLLRSQIAEGTKLGLEAKQFMDKGDLVPDAVVIGMIESKVKGASGSSGFIFDGFPRTVAQAEALDSLLNDLSAPITQMVALDVEEEELIKRILERGKTSGRADDQDESLVRNRLKEYNSKTLPLAEYYSKQDKFSKVHGMGGIDDIFEALCQTIDGVVAS